MNYSSFWAMQVNACSILTSKICIVHIRCTVTWWTYSEHKWTKRSSYTKKNQRHMTKTLPWWANEKKQQYQDKNLVQQNNTLVFLLGCAYRQKNTCSKPWFNLSLKEASFSSLSLGITTSIVCNISAPSLLQHQDLLQSDKQSQWGGYIQYKPIIMRV
jgi:hypothetical protein